MRRRRRARKALGPALPTHKGRKATRSQAPSKRTERNNYMGWKPKAGKVDRVESKELTPQRFWATYISQRRPVIVMANSGKEELSMLRNWTLKYLERKVGDVAVAVERRSSAKESFGLGRKESMPFREFVQQLRQQELLYLTTQEGSAGAESSHVAEVHPPLSCIRDDLPLQPQITGNLIPETINMWLGSSNSGASSGLHHDYHDNLYILLKGTKRFQIWSPAEAEHMYTHGSIAKVHSNGRIVYQGEGEVCADGSRLEDRLADTEKDRVAAIESVQAERLEEPGEDSEAELEAVLNQAVAGSSRGSHERVHQQIWSDDYEPSDSDDAATEERQNADPPSFSRVDLKLPHESLQMQFPRFPTASSLPCTLHAGDMLYLPAGWFHNVTSANSSVDGSGSQAGGFHMAVNYWFHPPDNLDASEEGFGKPYLHRFWPDRWKKHLEGLTDSTST